VAPNPEPVIVTAVPAGPDKGLRLVIRGATVKLRELLALPATVTTTFAGPAVTPVGTFTWMLVLLQPSAIADTPLNVTVLFP